MLTGQFKLEPETKCLGRGASLGKDSELPTELNVPRPPLPRQQKRHVVRELVERSSVRGEQARDVEPLSGVEELPWDRKRRDPTTSVHVPKEISTCWSSQANSLHRRRSCRSSSLQCSLRQKTFAMLLLCQETQHLLPQMSHLFVSWIFRPARLHVRRLPSPFQLASCIRYCERLPCSLSRLCLRTSRSRHRFGCAPVAGPWNTEMWCAWRS